MSVRGHLKLLGAATLVWLAFFVAGLPAYYRQYSTSALIVFEVLLLGPVAAAGVLVLRPRRSAVRMRHALRVSFHFTVPLLLYDALYCGLHLGRGPRFLVEYWYLTAYYVVPWALFPAIALWLNRGERRGDVAATAPERAGGAAPGDADASAPMPQAADPPAFRGGPVGSTLSPCRRTRSMGPGS